MLGDVFVKFTTQLRAYTNFLNNYPVTLQTLERVSDCGQLLWEFFVRVFRVFVEKEEPHFVHETNSEILFSFPLYPLECLHPIFTDKSLYQKKYSLQLCLNLYKYGHNYN